MQSSTLWPTYTHWRPRTGRTVYDTVGDAFVDALAVVAADADLQARSAYFSDRNGILGLRAYCNELILSLNERTHAEFAWKLASEGKAFLVDVQEGVEGDSVVAEEHGRDKVSEA